MRSQSWKSKHKLEVLEIEPRVMSSANGIILENELSLKVVKVVSCHWSLVTAAAATALEID